MKPIETTVPAAAAAAFALAALLAGGCSSKSTATSAPGSAPAAAASAVTIDEPARKEAREIFGTRCTVCHGATGAGDGAASAGLSPKPRNLQDASWQTSVTDEHIEKIVMYGGSAVGKSAAMPPNPDLSAKAAVVAAIREHVRGLKK